ncbi:alpha/beta-hydrolase [Xylariaceae sp. FL0016]|nr:alpha/beta-hydrolase [Xylariaceae sp. FL0016]
MEHGNWKRRIVEVDPGVSIAYIDCEARPAESQRGVIVLIHGFPQTSYQFRHVIDPLANAGYRVLAPDYRGAGASSKPLSGFTKSVMAQDIVHLLDVLEIRESVHVVGHDIGGMIAFAMAARHRSRVATVNWGECPLPGTSDYKEDRTTNAVQNFHFIFHSVPDLPLALVSGRERIYLTHFYRKLAFNADAIQEEDVDCYVRAYGQPGAMRCAFETYRVFEDDARENQEWIEAHGKLKMPALSLSGGESRLLGAARTMFAEVHDDGTFEVAFVPDASHYIAEENPKGFVRETLRFIEKATSLSKPV